MELNKDEAFLLESLLDKHLKESKKIIENAKFRDLIEKGELDNILRVGKRITEYNKMIDLQKRLIAESHRLYYIDLRK